MAKDLPYFKFNVSEWNDGDITICSMEAQGLFINLCSLYWSKEGRLSFSNVKRRFNGCNTTVWEELVNEQIIKLEGDNIFISFLDEQLVERKKLSETNSQNVAKRWAKEVSDTTVLPPNNDGKEVVYNIEEKREEERRKKKKREEPADAVPFVDKVLKVWDEWVQFRKEKKAALTPTTIKKQIQFLGGRGDPEIIAILNQSMTNGYTGLFELKKEYNGNRNGDTKTPRRADAIIEDGKDFGTF
jgi:hypothetical protein